MRSDTNVSPSHKANQSKSDLNETCPNCGQFDYIIIEEGQHLAKRCRNCGKWSRWVPHTPENLAKCEKPSAPKIAPTLFAVPDRSPASAKIQEPAGPPAAPCDHGRQLDLLIESLNCCNRHLSIVTRALMGQPLTKEAGQ